MTRNWPPQENILSRTGNSVVAVTELSTTQKIDLIQWQLAQQYQMLVNIQETLVTVSSEQADFNNDITTLTSFVSGLESQLVAIQTALSNQGVTDVAPLDNLIATIQNDVNPVLANLPGGTPPTTPPVTPTA
jgi:hypothetical protein